MEETEFFTLRLSLTSGERGLGSVVLVNPEVEVAIEDNDGEWSCLSVACTKNT